MLKVIIVDDEALIRIGIKSCINWEEYGFELVGQAEDGEKAKALIERERPDIVITDIRMPNMDGLELLRFLKQNYPEVKTIVLSCYNEIDYVKKAIKLGAEDYILKLSMEPENLLDILSKIKHLIESERNDKSKVIDQNEETSQSKCLIKDDLYKKILSKSLSPKVQQKELAALGIHFNFDNYLVLCCGIDDYELLKNILGDHHLFKASFVNLIRESFPSSLYGDITEIEENIYLILLNFAADREIIKTIINFCNKVNDVLQIYLNCSASFGISEIFWDYEAIVDEYEVALLALKHKFYLGKKSLVFYNQVGQFINKDIVFELKDERELLNKLQQFAVADAKEVVIRFLEGIERSKIYDPVKVKMVAVIILHVCIKFTRQYRIELETIPLRCKKSPLDELISADTIMDLKRCFETFIEDLIVYVSNIQQNAGRWEITTVKRYIAEHIAEEITLEKAAELCQINKCYFSSIFKKVTGENFTDYLNRMKMEKAKELIQEQGLRICEAAYKVGVSDQSYFSKLFKKYIGVNPSSIRFGNQSLK